MRIFSIVVKRMHVWFVSMISTVSMLQPQNIQIRKIVFTVYIRKIPEKFIFINKSLYEQIYGLQQFYTGSIGMR